MAIEQFRDEHYYLSNMYKFDHPILGPDGVEVYTTEQPYMASKFDDPEIRAAIMATQTGKAAKSLASHFEAKGIQRVEGWNEAKIPVMTTVVNMKFRANVDLAEQLIDTGEQRITEGNYWKDRFWGVSPVGSNNGLNNLGIILMNLRRQLSKEVREKGHILPPPMYNLGGLAVNAVLYPHLHQVQMRKNEIA
jgi:N-glycosidase YbiA